MSPSDSTKKL